MPVFSTYHAVGVASRSYIKRGQMIRSFLCINFHFCRNLKFLNNINLPRYLEKNPRGKIFPQTTIDFYTGFGHGLNKFLPATSTILPTYFSRTQCDQISLQIVKTHFIFFLIHTKSYSKNYFLFRFVRRKKS